MVNKNKYGSFTVKVNSEDVVVNPLSQKELSEGWRLVVPKVKSSRVVLSYGNKKVLKNKKNYKIFRINFSQLPEHLWCKVHEKYEDGQYSHSVARDNMYLYIIKDSPVDKEIKELYNYLFYKNYTDEIVQSIKDLVTVLEDNNISGWVLLRAKMIISKYSK
jgi:hypothetical protein